MERLYVAGELPDACGSDVDSAVAAASEAQRIWRRVAEVRVDEELVGPLATVTPVRDLDHAIELANDTRFGLGASIYTGDLEAAMRTATEIEAGMAWINDPLKDNDAAPFGGSKRSGLGRELGLEGTSVFTQAKHVHIDFAQVPSPEWWFPYKRPADE